MFQLVDWSAPQPFQTDPIELPSDAKPHLAWIASPPSPASGGHQNIFRFVKAAEDAGFPCTMYFWDWRGSRVNGDDLRAMLSKVSAYPTLKAEFLPYDGAVLPESHVIIATAWETAYASLLDPSRARRLYFVQDYEPGFYATGSNYLLAENTYRFGFKGITAGGWLARELQERFGMETRHFDFAADTSMYHVTKETGRKGIFFYARPETPRRAYEIGVRILELAHQIDPTLPIHFAGTREKDTSLPFPAIHHGAVDLTRLNDIYNQCSAALVMSLSNLSLLPLELIAAGVVPVVNDAPHNREVSDNPYIDYQPLIAARVAERLVMHASRDRSRQEYADMVASVSSFTWADSGRQFVQGLEELLAVDGKKQ